MSQTPHLLSLFDIIKPIVRSLLLNIFFISTLTNFQFIIYSRILNDHTPDKKQTSTNADILNLKLSTTAHKTTVPNSEDMSILLMDIGERFINVSYISFTREPKNTIANTTRNLFNM